MPNIAEIASNNDDFNLLVRALDAAGLVGAVADPNADLTVFAPTDAAFTQLALDLGFTGDTADEDAVFDAIVAALTDLSGGGDPIPLLTDVLLYHVSPVGKTAAEVSEIASIDTLLAGATVGALGATLSDKEPDLPNPTIVAPDIAADNGVIQAIDRVLLPVNVAGNEPAGTVVDVAVANGSFTILAQALTAAGLVGALSAADADVTVFAPTDAAFGRLAATLGFTGDVDDTDAVFGFIVEALTELGGGDPIPVLTDILLYHVSPGAKTFADIAGAGSVATLLTGAELSPDGAAIGDNDPEGLDPKIIIADVPASNGVVQAIDYVLLPLDLDIPAGVDASGVTGTGFGSQSADFILGDDAAQELRAGGGDDVIDGAGGADILRGAGGQDTVLGGAGDDLVFGGAGDDVVRGGAGNDDLFGNSGADQVFGDAGDDILRGGGGEDELHGGDGADNLRGGARDDIVNGDAGDDIARGGGGDDTLNGGEGADRVFGGIGDDIVNGGAGNDRVFGNIGDDVVSGGSGDDVVNGGFGNDTLSGGAGVDQFQFFHSFGDDVVSDFESGIDILAINLAVADSFDDLTVTQNGSDAVVSIGDRSITLTDVDSGNISGDDFIFI